MTWALLGVGVVALGAFLYWSLVITEGVYLGRRVVAARSVRRQAGDARGRALVARAQRAARSRAVLQAAQGELRRAAVRSRGRNHTESLFARCEILHFIQSCHGGRP